ncbi:ATP-dependent DNA helicase DinG [Spongiibacter sp. KMU-158]|uniref:ATP-dependent DNA helicase DinG n=1 Tax=Spongiibacter pelagi TaxID=2760804 RepID=A0A927C0N9_9GAMM|nr:ATP-dependent DNA helicase DinG [Spongiibacter pelagi]MBD2858023.1 ATP-dependent DNA helicase DinG [Spongiibacter pelagi]
MLSDTVKDEIQQAYRQFLGAKKLNPRYGQRLMIAHIARCLGGVKRNQDGHRVGGDHLCVVEAGTGTGKTLAYALAAIPIARERNKTLVISTATVALQEQILYRDLPDVLAHSGLHFSLALSKGRRRYLCLNKLDQLMSGGSGAFPLFTDEQAGNPDDHSLNLYRQFVESLGTGEWDGDRDSWETVIPENQWLPVTTDHAQCTGRRCSHVRQCSFFRARESLTQAEVVVANHDLVLADLALGGGAILPPPEDCIYIFDEAHHLPDKVINHFSANLRLGASERWLEQSERGLATMIGIPDLDLDLKLKLESLHTCMGVLRKNLPLLRPVLERYLEDCEEKQGRKTYRFSEGQVPDELSRLAADLRIATAAMVEQAENVVELFQERMDKERVSLSREDLENGLASASAVRFRGEAMLSLWQSYSIADQAGRPPLARWLILAESGQGLFDIELNSSPILASNTLKSVLWSRCHAAVMTSATLTALGKFDRFSMRAGLYEDASFEVVPSPFKHAEAGELYIPAMSCDAGNAEAHTDAIIELLPTLLDRSAGSLVLFSSRRQLNNVLENLPADWASLILAQDLLPKAEILKTHCERIDSGVGSVIFGLASFAEGVDLPGKYCSHVVIAKIPFAVPEDPVEEALAEWISQNNGNPFMEITVPDAAIKLVQASGRLLRNEADTGRITILDRRIVTRHYGRKMLASLPPYKQSIEN